MILLLAVAIVCNLMLFGIDKDLIFFGVMAVLLLALSSYLDPELSRERKLRRELRTLGTKERVVDGTLGRDETGKGYISSTSSICFGFSSLRACSAFSSRSSSIWWLSNPGCIKTVRACCSVPSRQFTVSSGSHDARAQPLPQGEHPGHFLVSAVIGGAFEFFVSWFMEVSFGAVAWDYSGTFLSIDGRTNGMFMAMGLSRRVLDQSLLALHAEVREHDSLASALHGYIRLRGADDRQRSDDASISRLLVRAAFRVRRPSLKSSCSTPTISTTTTWRIASRA